MCGVARGGLMRWKVMRCIVGVWHWLPLVEGDWCGGVSSAASKVKEIVRFMMDDPNITMEEYIKLQANKAQRRVRAFNWETASYVPFGIPFNPKRLYKDGAYTRRLRRPRSLVSRLMTRHLTTCACLGEEVRIFLLELIFTFPCKLRAPPRALQQNEDCLPLGFPNGDDKGSSIYNFFKLDL
ncbi:hypothetical protein Tco_0940924 [Tanacetum coccineum]|uniref:Uncharacterized protein n=1 Tax=Tanacetum coccineum TaxID=301880 RepID=A0ABQ5DPT4_9ASTR